MNDNLKFRRLCLLSLENKRNLNVDFVVGFCSELADCGYYFDKISRIAFDSADEIIRAFKDGKNNYENLFILCPKTMEGTVKQFLCGLYNGQFDILNVLSVMQDSVFIRFYDAENRMRIDEIKALLDKKYSVRYDRSFIRLVGAPRALVDRVIGKAKEACYNAKNRGEVYFNVTENYGDYRIEVVYSSETPKMLLDESLRYIIQELNDYVYALEDVSLAEQLYRLLKLRRMKLSVAESFTGGGICKRLVEIPGVSEVFFEGINSYSNESKMQRLGVKELTLKQLGAVSADTAEQMACGLVATGNCDVAVSTTGIAGPKSDNTAKPVGLAFIGVCVGGECTVHKFNFEGDRTQITQTAINQALFLVYKRLK